MSAEKKKLVLVWTTADREAAMNMILLYGRNAKKHGWWEEVDLLIWGPSGKTLLSDVELQAEVSAMKEEGIGIIACKGCAERFGIVEDLEGVGVKVFYTGVYLTEAVKADEVEVLTF